MDIIFTLLPRAMVSIQNCVLNSFLQNTNNIRYISVQKRRIGTCSNYCGAPADCNKQWQSAEFQYSHSSDVCT